VVVAAIGYFAIAVVVIKYRALYVATPAFESGGLLWPLAVNRLMFAAIAFQVITLAVFAFKDATYEALVLLPLPFITATFWFRMLHLHQRSLHLPIDAANSPALTLEAALHSRQKASVFSSAASSLRSLLTTITRECGNKSATTVTAHPKRAQVRFKPRLGVLLHTVSCGLLGYDDSAQHDNVHPTAARDLLILAIFTLLRGRASEAVKRVAARKQAAVLAQAQATSSASPSQVDMPLAPTQRKDPKPHLVTPQPSNSTSSSDSKILPVVPAVTSKPPLVQRSSRNNRVSLNLGGIAGVGAMSSHHHSRLTVTSLARSSLVLSHRLPQELNLGLAPSHLHTGSAPLVELPEAAEVTEDETPASGAVASSSRNFSVASSPAEPAANRDSHSPSSISAPVASNKADPTQASTH
jgi:hypothetical protein